MEDIVPQDPFDSFGDPIDVDVVDPLPQNPMLSTAMDEDVVAKRTITIDLTKPLSRVRSEFTSSVLRLIHCFLEYRRRESDMFSHHAFRRSTCLVPATNLVRFHRTRDTTRRARASG